MNTKHLKSSCCKEKIIRFGGRRRQCALCKKTWRIRHKKSGRKQVRVAESLAKRYFDQETLSTYRLSRRRSQSESKLNLRLNRSIENYSSKRTWPKLPQKPPVIVIADAMITTIDSKTYTFYFILIRTPNTSEAVIAKPYVSEGIETWLGWQEAFSKLPISTFESIRAIVCDGHNGLTSLAKKYDWLIQRCQFHLLASLQGRRSKSAKSRHQKIGQILFQSVSFVINSLDEKENQKRIKKLKVIRKNSSSKILRKIISGFLKHYQDYQTYLVYPELKLPRTSNTAESLISSVRNMVYRAHGFRTIKSLKFKVFALLKHKRKVTCNGYHQPN